jgi:hypothetical protein
VAVPAFFTFERRSIASLAGTLLPLCSVSCEQLVVLGTECPEASGPCIVQGAGDKRDAGEDLDAGEELAADAALATGADDTGVDTRADTGLPEAGVQMLNDAAAQDGASDATTASFLPLGLQNPEFQRNPGVPAGDLVLSDLVDAITLGIVIADLPNWYACWFGSVNSVSWDLDQDAGAPLYRGDYLSLVLNSVFDSKIEPARQKLAMPMQAGASYALEMDVLGLPDNGAQLYMEIRGHDADCGGDGTMLARAEIQPERTWTTLCMQFTPQQNFSYFLIGTGYSGAQPSTNARVRLDTLRQVSSCSGQR